MTSVEMHSDTRIIYDKIFKESETERETELRILDIPYLHDPNRKEAEDFIRVISNLSNLEIFKCTSVRAILAFRWPLTYSANLTKLMIPYIFYLSCYLAWILMSYNNHTAKEIRTERGNLDFAFNILLQLSLLVISIYFLVQESR